MPRDGSNIYSQPFPDVVEDTTIESTVYNGFTNDVAQDLNAPRPIVAGGTGATNADDARFNMGAEVSAQLVTNYDSNLWVPGSFRSAVSATGAPNAHAFTGICYIGEALANPPTNQNVTVEARDVLDGVLYVRTKTAGTWGAWAAQAGSAANLDAAYVNTAGDTMSGDLTISKASPNLILSKTAAAQDAVIIGQNSGSNRWIMALGGNSAESGSNAGSGFFINRYSDGGAYLSTPISITRANGRVSIEQTLHMPSGFLNVAATNAIQMDWNGTLLQYKIDGAAARPLFDTTNSPLSGTGYQKFATGSILQWGLSGVNPDGAFLTFPTAFPNTCQSVQMTPTGSLAATNSLAYVVASIALTGFTPTARYVNNGGAVGVASQQFYWFASGY